MRERERSGARVIVLMENMRPIRPGFKFDDQVGSA